MGSVTLHRIVPVFLFYFVSCGLNQNKNTAAKKEGSNGQPATTGGTGTTTTGSPTGGSTTGGVSTTPTGPSVLETGPAIGTYDDWCKGAQGTTMSSANPTMFALFCKSATEANQDTLKKIVPYSGTGDAQVVQIGQYVRTSTDTTGTFVFGYKLPASVQKMQEKANLACDQATLESVIRKQLGSDSATVTVTSDTADAAKKEVQACKIHTVATKTVLIVQVKMDYENRSAQVLITDKKYLGATAMTIKADSSSALVEQNQMSMILDTGDNTALFFTLLQIKLKPPANQFATAESELGNNIKSAASGIYAAITEKLK